MYRRVVGLQKRAGEKTNGLGRPTEDGESPVVVEERKREDPEYRGAR